MRYASSTALLASLALTGLALADDCAQACTVNKNACLIKPGANRSTCASEYSSCLGYNPYDKQPYVEPTSCSKGGSEGDQCLPKCEDVKNKCFGAPGSNKSTCSSDYDSCKSTCSGSTPGPNPSGGQCLPKCEDAKNKCFGAPGSNKSTCSSDYDSCKSSCSGSTPGPNPNGGQCLPRCEDAKNKCFGAPGSNKSTCSSDYDTCKSTCSGASKVVISGSQQCQTCDDAQNKCLADPGSNKSTCASEYATCCKTSCPDKNVEPNRDGVSPVLVAAGGRISPLMGFLVVAAMAAF